MKSVRPCFLPDALLTNITRWAHLPLAPAVQLEERLFRRPDPGTQPPTAGNTQFLRPLPFQVPWRSSDFLPPTNRNCGVVYMRLGKGIKGTNIQGQSQKCL